MIIKIILLFVGLQGFFFEGKLVLIIGFFGGIGLVLVCGMVQVGVVIVFNGCDVGKFVIVVV